MYRNLDRRFIARVIVTPSFRPEYLLCIQNQNDSIIMIYNVLSDVFWGSKDTQKIKVITYQVMVDKQFSDIIHQTFNYFLLDTHYPKESDNGADGVTYEFMTYERRWNSSRVSVVSSENQVAEAHRSK